MFGWSMRKRKRGAETVTLKINGMKCGACVRHVTSALQSLPGVDVEQAEVGSATVSRDASKTTDEALLAALAEAGYEASKEVAGDNR